MGTPRISVIGLTGIPTVEPGADLPQLLIESIERAAIRIDDGDVIVVAQKIVSKAEGRFVDLETVTPSPVAVDVAARVLKDPRLVEVILGQSRRIVRSGPNVLIVEHQLGFIMANAGVDQSNVNAQEGRWALLLPEDPDDSAEQLRAGLASTLGVDVAIVINDSFGRPFRVGSVGVAIGSAGLPAVVDMRGERDLFGRELKVTVVGFADEIASAASLVMGQAAEAIPATVVKGLAWRTPPAPARSLLRLSGEDLFR
jgi:coenzyme F420-0:L-glutamate ligase/coenzyme F420-1:gamma-L-glutamate ligase